MPLTGLTVNASGQLARSGERFRNIGLNYGGAIQRIYNQPSTTACAYTPSAEQDAVIATCQTLKVKVLRIKAFPYWPAQWTAGVNAGKAWNVATAADREAHYLKIDAFIAKCRAAGIGVILNMFFRLHTISDLVGGNGRTWLSAGNTRTFAQTITQELVNRYLTDDTVLGWELSNEINHYNDATDDTKGNFPGANTSYGTQASYTAANDLFKSSEWASVGRWWYGVVSAIDSQRICLTGNGPNTYTLETGSAGIPTPMFEWHRQQVRDNPTNCASIHWYGNVGYSSPNFRGLNAVLTGVRHWSRQADKGFVLGEFGNQPWAITALSGDGTTLTATVAKSCPVEVGDSVQIGGTGSAFDGLVLTLASVNEGRTTLTAPCNVIGTWSGSVKGLQHINYTKLSRMCADIINSGTDVALFWLIDRDPLTPMWESIEYTGNEGIRDAIREANESLGW